RTRRNGHCDLVCPDVIRMSVSTVGLVADHDLRIERGDELHQLLSLQLWRAAGERPWMLGGGCSRHTGVPPTTDPTQVAMFTNPQLVQCRGQLTGTVATELISLSRAERTQLRWNDLALLAERAGHQA